MSAEFLTIDKLAESLATEGELPSTVKFRIYTWRKKGLPCYQVSPGGKLRFRLVEVLAWLAKNQTVVAFSPRLPKQ